MTQIINISIAVFVFFYFKGLHLSSLPATIFHPVLECLLDFYRMKVLHELIHTMYLIGAPLISPTKSVKLSLRLLLVFIVI